MKHKFKHKTGTFGTDGEWYAAQLFQMTRQDHGTRKPDLISLDGAFNPQLALEVKSGRQQKGVLVEYQLHYRVQTRKDYIALFGEEPPERSDALEGMETIQLDTKPIAFYYNMLHRVDTVLSGDIQTPFAAIKCRWGDHYIVPGEYGFWAFVAARSIRTKESPLEIAEDLKELMRKNILDETSNYSVSKGSQSWQDLHGRDILAFFHNDLSLTTKEGKSRTDLIRTYFPQVDDLKRVEIKGPNKTRVYVLSLPKHVDLFDKQLRSVVRKTKPVIEQVTAARSESVALLERFSKSDEQAILYANGNLPENYTHDKLSQKELKLLERLSKWTEQDDVPF